MAAKRKPQSLMDVAETQELETERRLAAAARDAEYPMCTKLNAVRNDKAILLCFLDWLEENNLKICEFTDTEHSHGDYFPIVKTEDKLLMEYFGIDEKKLEEERRKILAAQQKLDKVKA
jgi:hypothetical protein